MNNPEKLATLGTPDVDKKKDTKNTTQYVFDTNIRNIRKQTI